MGRFIVGYARLCKLLLVVVIALFLLSIMPGVRTAVAQPFDVQGHWAEKEIIRWVDQGLAGGYPDGSFKPNRSVTRAEFVALVNRAFGIQDPQAKAAFRDVNRSDWFYGEVAAAVEAGYAGGYSDGTFKPHNAITRQEVASIVSRLLQLGDDAPQAVFQDTGTIAAWAADTVNAAVAAGIMCGYTDGTFGARNPITRAEAVVTLDRTARFSASRITTITYNQVYDAAGTYGPFDGAQTIHGDAIVEVAGVVLRNLIITGDLLLADGIGDGDVTLRNVTVEGETTIKGGGANSVALEDCSLSGITVAKDGVRVIAAGNTIIDAVTLESGAALVEAAVTGAGFETVTISEVVPAGTRVTLAGHFGTVYVKARDVEIEIVEGTVEELILDAKASVTGAGGIGTAHINADGSRIEQTPAKVEVAAGVTGTVSGKKVSGVTGSDRSRQSTVKVTAVSVSPSTMTLMAGGAKGIITATVSPANASNKKVIWSSSNNAVATVEAGIVTPVAAGTALITAASAADARIKATAEVIVEELPLSAVDDAIAQAQAAMVDVVISADGSDVEPGRYWVTPEAKDALDAAIREAEAARDAVTSPQEIEAVVAELMAAVEAFNNGKARGLKAVIVSIREIKGVAAPITGEAPVDSITENEQYRGEVTWDPDDALFRSNTVYTATITLSPKPGFTLDGLEADFFTVAEAESVTYEPGSGVVTAVFPETLPFAGGDGSESDPWRISNPYHLDNVRNHLGDSFILINDIDLSHYLSAEGPGYDGGKGWRPLGVRDRQFTGKFNGNGYRITGLRIDRPTDDNVGLFGYTSADAEIRNLRVEEVCVTGGIFTTGGLVGCHSSGIISNCSVAGSVCGSAFTGGLVGQNKGSIVYSCNLAAVSGSGNTGGLVGRNNNSIGNCYSRGSVSGTQAGGLVGYNVSTGKIINSYNSGSVSNRSGGLVGNGNGPVENSYWDTGTSGCTASAGGEGKTTEQMKRRETYPGWDFDTVWGIDPDRNEGYPFLRWQQVPVLSR